MRKIFKKIEKANLKKNNEKFFWIPCLLSTKKSGAFLRKLRLATWRRTQNDE